MTKSMIGRKSVFAAAAILSSVLTGNALAMPTAKIEATASAAAGIQDARWPCGPYRCWWHPNYYGGWRHYYGYYRGPIGAVGAGSKNQLRNR